MLTEKEKLSRCHQAISPYIHRTPVMTSRLIDEEVGASVFFKCENFQRTGAYKMRGAVNAILNLTEEQKQKGVVTHSSGNFAQALSLAAQSLNVPAYIVMPSNAPGVKKEAAKNYGGFIVQCEPTLKAREINARRIQNEKGATFIHPSNNDQVILGQGTAAMELFEDYPDLQALFVPIGGGGLAAGTCLATKHFGRGCEVVGAEPEEADDAYRSLLSGKIEENVTTHTIADGLRTQLGDLNFPIIRKHIHQIATVSEKEIISAMRLIWERMKLVVEPSSAVALAALLKERDSYKDQQVGLIISGGNVDLGNLPFTTTDGPTAK
nr:pyridoxal-phosphate dependent enzyme [Saprospiraceae bacterium]